MKIIKLTHACLLVEHNNEQLLIDPGVFTEDIPDVPNLKAVIITHAHPDHINDVWLKELQEQAPHIPIYSDKQVADAYPNIKFVCVKEDQIVEKESFTIDFALGTHATIHPDMPEMTNMAIHINKTLFYPGDSFMKPKQHVKVLACPVSAPWMKISETIDYIKEVKADRVFATHDALFSDIGNNVTHPHLEKACEAVGSQWHYAIPGEQIETS